MTKVEFDFRALRDAASSANKAAGKMDSYADDLPRIVNNPLASLEGGSSEYTSTAATLASSKQAELRSRASAYRSFSSQVELFIDTAQTVDASVGQHLSSVADARSEDMNWWEKGQYYLYKMFNHAFGSSEAGAIVGNIINVGSYVHEKKMECLKSIRDWFAHGDGKYVLNIALAAIAAIGAVVAVILTFPAGTILATIVLMATIVASIVTITDSGAKIVENVKALKMNSTEPGQARYYGNTSDLTDFTMKESTDKEQQDRAKWIDTTGKIAGFVAFVGGFGVTRNSAGTNVTSPGFKNGKGCVLENIGGKFGFKYDATAKANHFSFDPKGFLGFGKETVEGTKLPNWYKTLDKINNNAIAPSERALKLLQGDTSWDGHFDGHKDATRIISQLSNIHPGFKGYDKIISYGKDFYDFVTGSDPVSKVKPMQFSTYHGGGKF